VTGTSPITVTNGTTRPVVGLNASLYAPGSILYFTATIGAGTTIPANSSTTVSMTVAGLVAGARVIVNATTTLNVGISVTNAFVGGTNSLSLEIINCSTSSSGSLPAISLLIVQFN
jgi:hypothetical protein